MENGIVALQRPEAILHAFMSPIGPSPWLSACTFFFSNIGIGTYFLFQSLL